jgi:hypothetical protein
MIAVAHSNNNQATHSIEQLKQKIWSYYSYASEQEVQKLAELSLSFEALKHYLEQYPEEQTGYEQIIERLTRNLDYKRPFRLAVVAKTGDGKSTLINALLGRDIVTVTNMGPAATGCSLEIFQNVSDSEPEKAFIDYRNEKDIWQLIDHFTKSFHLNQPIEKRELTQKVAATLAQLKPNQPPEKGSTFYDDREILVKVIRQYLQNKEKSLDHKFLLNDPQQVERLKELTNEGSVINEGADRCIDLIKSVRYYLNPVQEQQTLQLPQNVCLIDLPGLGGNSVHDMIITEGIANADAVLFLVTPKRFGIKGDQKLLEEIRHCISANETFSVGERVILIMNGIDDVMEEMKQNPEALDRARQQFRTFAKGLFGNHQSSSVYQPIEISAKGAFLAQKLINGEKIASYDTYDKIKIGLGRRNSNDSQVLEATGVPRVREKVSELLNNRTAVQIREIEQGINTIITSLLSKHQQEKEKLTQGKGDFFIRQEFKRTIAERSEMIYDAIKNLRRSQSSQRYYWNQQLQNQLNNLCTTTYHQLQKEFPKLWKEHVMAWEYRPNGEPYIKVKKESLLGEIEIKLWEELPSKMSQLGETLAEAYQKEWRNLQLCEYISSLCFGKLQPSLIESQFQQAFSTMKANLKTAIQYIILSQMTDPQNAFISYFDDNSERINLNLENLNLIPLNFEIRSSDAEAFIRDVRRFYDSLLTVCIGNLLNIQTYEMLSCEQKLLSLVEQKLDELERSEDPVVQQELLEGSHHKQWSLLRLLEEKIAALQQLSAFDPLKS